MEEIHAPTVYGITVPAASVTPAAPRASAAGGAGMARLDRTAIQGPDRMPATVADTDHGGQLVDAAVANVYLPAVRSAAGGAARQSFHALKVLR